jgi:hypothetical protein
MTLGEIYFKYVGKPVGGNLEWPGRADLEVSAASALASLDPHP